MIDQYKKRRLEQGYSYEAEYTFTARGKEYTRNAMWTIPLDFESRIDMLGLMERARNGESITYTFRSEIDVVFEPEEFLKVANKALNLYSKIHHLAKDCIGLKGDALRAKILDLLKCE